MNAVTFVQDFPNENPLRLMPDYDAGLYNAGESLLFCRAHSIVIDTGDMNMREIFKNGTKRDEA